MVRRNLGPLILWGFVAVLAVLAGTTHIFAGTSPTSDDFYVADELEVDGSVDVAGAIVAGGNISTSGDVLATGDMEAGDDLVVGDDLEVGVVAFIGCGSSHRGLSGIGFGTRRGRPEDRSRG